MNLLAFTIKKAQDLELKIVEAGGEISPELETLFAVDLNQPDAVEETLLMIERCEHGSDYWKAKAETALAVSRSLAKWAHLNREHVKRVMIDAGTMDLYGHDHRFKLSQLKPKVAVDEEKLPKEYFKEKITLAPDKDRIADDLRLGVPVEGAQLEPVYSLRSYPIKKELK